MDLATHSSGLPDWPDNLCPDFDSGKTGFVSPIPNKFDGLYQRLYI